MEPEKQQLSVGSLVLADIRTGRYIGEISEFYGPRAVVKILAVVRHPQQGDLHHPYDPDVPLFHERRALSYTEKSTVLLRDIEPFGGEVPDYSASLAEALDKQTEELAASLEGADDRYKRWIERSIDTLRVLRADYRL
ncbi:sporulation phosphorelay system protein KapB [Paenibacillus thailandensis]|uniref:Sporulation phosphorelay system protein KapB n=1 Tax=Paenibacillus thailandensis TaxID=393250 RepID=A0ABW5R1G0_9BACL